MATEGKKGLTVQLPLDLHAEVKQYVESNNMTMAEFVILALNDELHPKYQEKEENNMANMRTLAFQVPEDLFQRIKDYLRRNNMTQKEFVIGLIESEIERDLTAREAQDKASQIAEVKEDETLEDEDTVYEEVEDAEEEEEEEEEEREDEGTETEEEAEDEFFDANDDELEEEAEDEFLGEDEELEETDEDAELGEYDTDELDDESEYDEDEEETEGLSMGM